MTVRVGVLDVGSNTIRLLVADIRGQDVVPVDKGRVRLALGEEIEKHGVVSATSIRAAEKAVKKLRAVAAERGVEDVDVFLTAPGRQASNAEELIAALNGARVLSTDEEGRLAYRGGVATCDVELPASVAVCDVGGASTEIAVGSPADDPTWTTSVDLGAVRLTARASAGADVRAEAASAFVFVEPPPVQLGLAVGGTARAARRLVGPRLGAEELETAMQLVETLDEGEIVEQFDVDPDRVPILAAGIAILTEVQRVLDVPLHVCDGGLREGAALALRSALAA